MEQKKYTLEERTVDVYLQKSLKFLYPLLKIKNVPKDLMYQTYLAWSGEIVISKCKLICVYEQREDAIFKKFEDEELLKNQLLEDYKEADDNKVVFIFNMESFKADILHFLRGHYSKMSVNTTSVILNYYSLNKYSWEYMDSYFNPGKYFEMYAALLNVAEWRLRDTGELCDRFNPQKETLCLKKVDTSVNKENLLLFS